MVADTPQRTQPHTAICTPAHFHSHCHTLPRALLHTAVRTATHTLPRTVPRCSALLHCRTLPHTAAHSGTLPHCWTAAHCSAHCHTLQRALPHTAAACTATQCRTVPHSAALPDSRTLPRTLPHTVPCTTAHCCAHGHTPLLALAHTATLPHTATH
jgi:hypothetical protein